MNCRIPEVKYQVVSRPQGLVLMIIKLHHQMHSLFARNTDNTETGLWKKDGLVPAGLWTAASQDCCQGCDGLAECQAFDG